ncbi:hypothetical protein EFY87_18430 [Flexivirga caeni]|uniref:Cardiolipin synthase N-terminal domain-containing protein n=1 Tax=Flexivirga caeni TaxID=2294115 RepID=A0A3M9LZZ7_9MICO|nr:hypothetical protein EFY87_18430 [Flexivirga caeni]
MLRTWRNLSPTQRRLVITVGALEAAAKAAALIDLSRRPASEIRGPKLLWAVALPTVNSAGLLPAAYFLVGRRR